MRKKITHLILVNFLVISFIFCPIFGTANLIYADSVPDGYSPAGLNDQVDAFRYYCKSRNLAIEGSVLDAVTQVTSKVYQTAVAGAGFDINQLQNEIYKNTGAGQNFFFTVSGISAMNRIFAEFLQNNDLAVGDSVENQDLYSGKWFVDADGNGCLVYVLDSSQGSAGNAYFLSEGTPYKYSSEQIQTNVGEGTYTFTFNVADGQTISRQLWYSTTSNSSYYRYRIGASSSFSTNWTFWKKNIDRKTNAEFIQTPIGYYIILQTSDGSLHFTSFAYTSQYYMSGPFHFEYSTTMVDISSNASVQPANVYITTNNTTINNNNYEGDTIINNNGKVTQPDKPIPDPNDNHTTVTNPVQPDTPDSDSNLTFPLLDLDLPSIDWSIGDLTHKFPFSIPFDLINLVQVFDAEPEAPRFQGTIDFGFTTYDYDMNFEEFDSVASVFRTCSLIGFIFGLIVITRNLIR